MTSPARARLPGAEARAVGAAFVTLFGMAAAHALLETARDALFLARLPPSQLPWAYLAIAAGAAAISQVPLPSSRTRLGRHALPLVLLATAGVTLAVWASGASGPWTVRALYVWTGVNATITGLHFWLRVGERWTVTQAKRTYRWVALGGLLGGIAGAALARGLAAGGPPDRLVLASALVQALAAAGPALLLAAPRRAGARPRVSLRSSRRLLRERPYVRGLASLALLATLALTAADFVFKSHVAREVPASQLAWFFATFYTVLNALALVTQLAVTGWLLRVLGLVRAQQVLPALLLVASGGVVAGLGAVAALLLKIADGSLREAHRTTSELLLVPLPDDVRARTKPLLDVVVRRGGQALASIAILAAMALPGAEAWVAAATALLSLAWMAQAIALRRPYLDLFRTALRDRAPAELPPVDLGSLEALFVALGSDDDAEVVAAMDVLADQGRARLVPSVILYHPSEEVALHALALFERSGRRDLGAAADRLLGHPSARMRAAALQARASPAPEDGALLRGALADASPVVRAAAAVALVSLGELAHGAGGVLAALLADPDPEARRALARAIAHRPSPALEDVLLALASSEDPEVLVDVSRAAGALRSARLLPGLLGLLERREVRAPARAALLAFGDEGLAFLEAALADASLPGEIRRHVPRTISRFEPERAGRVLLARLPDEPDGLVRFKILRGLGRIVADSPAVELDRSLLRRAAERTLEAAFRLVRWRTVLEAGAREDPRRATRVHALLAALLRDKERHATERLFRLLALDLRGEDLEDVHRGLENADPRLRASSRELLEHLLRPALRGPVLALVDEAPDLARLARAGSFAPRGALEYEGLLAALLDAPGDTLRTLTVHHVAELGLAGLRDEIVRLRRERATPLLERAAARALRALPERTRGAPP